MKYYRRVKIVLLGQIAGLLLVNIFWAVHRFNTMGFYEALGRSIFATLLGIGILTTTFLVSIGIVALWDKDNR